jgi:ferredoxin
VLHKFSIYPEKFGEILCTGCGNCTRNCPARLGMLTLLTGIEHACYCARLL